MPVGSVRPVAIKIGHQAGERTEAFPGLRRVRGPTGFRYGRQAWKHEPVEDRPIRHRLGPDAGLDAEQVALLLFRPALARIELVGLLRPRPAGPAGAGL